MPSASMLEFSPLGGKTLRVGADLFNNFRSRNRVYTKDMEQTRRDMFMMTFGPLWGEFLGQFRHTGAPAPLGVFMGLP